MKKLFKMILWFFLSILGLLIFLIVFLNGYYSVLGKKQAKQEKALEARSKDVITRQDSVVRISEKPVLNLIPVPQKVQFTGGNYVLPSALVYSVTDSLKRDVDEYLKTIPDIKTIYSESGGNIVFRYKAELPVQGYTLDIRPGKLTVEYSNKQGLYYAIVSLKVLKQNYSGTIPCVLIKDFPDLEVRGLMLDISRDKVPTKETLMGIIQLLADLKFNHFELYIEGFSFAYPSFKNLWERKETPVTGEEIKELNVFCTSHFIDFVPNQNLFGHMMSWLATDQFKDLAECPKGYKIMGLVSMKGTLDPSDPRSIELVSKMTDDLLPNFTSDYYNVNLDEPFELGKGKSTELVAEKGEGEVYLDYAKKIRKIAVSKNKKMLMWADIVFKHPDLIPLVPKDITLLDWGYESSYPYERHSKMLQSAGLSYMVCPGTNSWTTITGRTDNMLATIESATTNGVKYGAKGMLLTDWGDMGHWQYLPVSYAGYTTGGALSWNSKSAKELPLSRFLNSYVFRDESSIMGDLVLDLGRYNRFEEFPMFNMTTSMMALQFGLRDEIMVNAILEKMISGLSDLMKDIAPEMTDAFKENYGNRHQFDYQGLNDFMNSKEALLKGAAIQTADSTLIKDEYLNAIQLIRLGSGLKSYIHNRRNLSPGEEKSQLKNLSDLGHRYLAENQRLWLLRDKPGGYERSTTALNTLLNQIDNRITLLDKSSLSRGLGRFFEKLGTAGAVLYLKSAK
ncbi:MAG: beta-N-acetylhexosaminidase [Bacteroidota bacterium]